MANTVLPSPGYWLQTLSNHPVLDTSSSTLLDDSQTTPDVTLPDISSIALEAPSNHTLDVSGPDFMDDMGDSFATPDSRQSLIAVRDGLAVTCLNSSPPRIRLLNLRKWKGSLDETGDDVDKALETADFKELVSPTLSFRVRQIQMNGTGRLLAVVGEYEIVVLSLPRIAWTDGNTRERIRTNSWRIGPMTPQPIVKIHWHPLSESHTHLMVLSDDGALRIYDVTANANEPEQTLHFLGSEPIDTWKAPNRSGMFGADLWEREFVSFCVGRDDGNWGSMTMYGVTRSGDVYSLCPVVPQRSIFIPQKLQDLKAASALEQEEHEEHECYGPYTERQYYWREQWLDELLNEINQRSIKETLPGEPVGLTLPRMTAKVKCRARGPYLIQPSPDATIDYQDATDILCLATNPINVLIISFESGMLRTCIDLEGPVPLWNINAEALPGEAPLPVLRIHEDIDISWRESSGSQQTAPVRIPSSLAADPRHDAIFYCYHSFGVHRVSVEPWVSPLRGLSEAQADEAQLATELKSAMEQHIESDVSLLFSTRTFISTDVPSVVGFAVITEASLGYCYLLLTSHPHLYGDILPMHVNIPWKISEVTANEMYTPSMEPPIFDIPEVVRKAPPPLRLPTGASAKQVLAKCTHPPTLWAFFEHLKARRCDILDLHEAIIALRTRLERQQSELKQQAGALMLLDEKIKQNKERLKQLPKKMHTLRVKEYVQRKSLGIILQILIENSQPLTDAEKQWIKELHHIRNALQKRLKPWAENVQEQVHSLLQDRNPVEDPDKDAELDQLALGQTQMRRIETALRQEYKLLAGTAQKLTKLQNIVQKMEDTIRLKSMQSP
ncbi:uncharacterized protein SPPG_03026 [Spizellomyces punctatus DAOM BR117]|uniref:Uncharacterized protein n=1 Tax=Spizellomyces punctatus (strain DAOM BR117) TaxID=645134 RepID=A0A0L0HP55_SPIPD|nr:uncharacterized protein SPPG_03026 [Spizellomyces punctatus DAOM BR117]KND02569.1 hypothetical protein SPPG_03026 [Spizellomyces punctatus DAOM BR117]|eukprot:XP_016610608.1 hypothetical protein SPPG_03026 [Spizellomyces punctatus DAOM BR117]